MPIDFPSGPSVNQTYTYNGQVYKWTGVSWDVVRTSAVGPTGPTGPTGPAGSGGGGSFTVADTAPSTPNAGDVWFDSTDGKAYIYFDSYWVEFSGSSLTPPDDRSMTIAVSDETTNLTTGAAKLTFRAPHAMTLTSIPRISLGTAASTGTTTVDVNVGGSSIFSTLLTITGTATTSVGQTPAVLSTTSIADDAIITVDIDTVGTGARGLKLTLYYRRTS